MASSAIVTITVVVKDTAPQTVQDRYSRAGALNPAMGCEDLRKLLEAVAAGSEKGAVHVFIDKADGTQATGTVALVQATSAVEDYVRIGVVQITAKTTPSTQPQDGEFAIGASNTAMGDNFAAAVNAHPALRASVTASNASGTVTLTAKDKGTHGNLIVMSKVGTGITLTQMASGAKGTVQLQARTYNRGA